MVPARFGHLPGAWLRAARQVGARGDIAGGGAELLAAWSQPHRYYHDLRHLDEVLRRVEDLAAHATRPDAVRLAAWFHDSVYDPRRYDNEDASAAYAGRILTGLAVPDPVVAEVERLVRLTAGHDPVPGDADGAVLCDADLAVLAAEPARYAEYAGDVRREYAHVGDDAFAEARGAVLRGLLERPALYRTPTARAWDRRAVANVEGELRRLRD